MTNPTGPLDEDARRDLETWADHLDSLVTDPDDLAALGRGDVRNRQRGYLHDCDILPDDGHTVLSALARLVRLEGEADLHDLAALTGGRAVQHVVH